MIAYLAGCLSWKPADRKEQSLRHPKTAINSGVQKPLGCLNWGTSEDPKNPQNLLEPLDL